jgi:glutamate/tyrosine decarboxylase-like PLP-dependent enzyme
VRRPPAAALVEESRRAPWLKEALGLPHDASFGIVTGSAGRETRSGSRPAATSVLERAGGTSSATACTARRRIRVVAGEERHATIDRALRLLGIGRHRSRRPERPNGAVDADGARRGDRGRLGRTDHRRRPGRQREHRRLRRSRRSRAWRARHGAWVHVDGAFGLWARPAPAFEHLVAGREGGRLLGWSTATSG